MNKLVVCACENIAPEIAAVLTALGQDDIRLEILPCICLSKQKKKDLTQQLLRIAEEPADRLLICSNQCGTIEQLPQVMANFEIIMNSSCFGHLIANELFEYITENGGYIVSTGWLKNWRGNLAVAGFDDGTARNFFGEFAKELVFLDLGLSTEIRAELQALSVYIDIPVRILPIDAEKVKTLLQKQIL